MSAPGEPSSADHESPPREHVAVGAGKAVLEGVKDAFAPAVRLIDQLGDHVILFARAMSWLPRRPMRATNYLEACEYIGFGSLPIILLVGAFASQLCTGPDIS